MTRRQVREKDVGKMERSNIRVSGTEVFDIVLIVVILILMTVATITVRKSIANPARDASRHLSEIVDKIEHNHGDLTERIQTKSKDEIGQLVNGVNGFIDQLQELMKKISDVSSKISLSTGEVSGRIDESNQSAMNVSAATEQLAAGMEEITATIGQIAKSSNGILEQVEGMNEKAKNGRDPQCVGAGLRHFFGRWRGIRDWNHLSHPGG